MMSVHPSFKINPQVHGFLFLCRLKRLLYRKSYARFGKDALGPDEITTDTEQDDLFVERIRIENMKLRLSIFSIYC